jgi:hypothetical protein
MRKTRAFQPDTRLFARHHLPLGAIRSVVDRRMMPNRIAAILPARRCDDGTECGAGQEQLTAGPAVDLRLERRTLIASMFWPMHNDSTTAALVGRVSVTIN